MSYYNDPIKHQSYIIVGNVLPIAMDGLCVSFLVGLVVPQQESVSIVHEVTRITRVPFGSHGITPIP